MTCFFFFLTKPRPKCCLCHGWDFGLAGRKHTRGRDLEQFVVEIEFATEEAQGLVQGDCVVKVPLCVTLGNGSTLDLAEFIHERIERLIG